MRTILRIAICWVAFAAALMLSGVISGILRLPAVPMPGNTPPQTMFLAQLIAGLVLVVGLVPLSRGLAAPATALLRRRRRQLHPSSSSEWCPARMIEAKMFTHFLDNGIVSASAFYVVLGVLLGAAGWLVALERRRLPLACRITGWLAWIPRVAAVWLAWPVIYFFFGACVSPIVVPYYNAGIAGLRIPALSTILAVQLSCAVSSSARRVTAAFIAALEGLPPRSPGFNARNRSRIHSRSLWPCWCHVPSDGPTRRPLS